MDKLNITPTPWQLSTIPIELMTTDSAASIWSSPYFNGGASLIADVSRSAGDKESLANAEAIVKAVNGTYGIGVNPEAVENMKVALHEFIDWAEKNAMWDKCGQSYYRAKATIEKAKL